MLWTAYRDLDFPDAEVQFKFAMGEELFVLYGDGSDDVDGWKMEAIDSETLRRTTLSVGFDNLDPPSLFLLFDAIGVCGDRAYALNYEQRYVYEGRVEDNEFRWRYEEHSGTFPRFGLSFSHSSATSDSIMVLHSAHTAGALTSVTLHKLSLPNLAWTSHDISYNPAEVGPLGNLAHTFSKLNWDAHAQGRTVHLFFVDQQHLMVDLGTRQLREAPVESSWRLPGRASDESMIDVIMATRFTAMGALWKHERKSPSEPSSIFRFSMTSLAWVKHGSITYPWESTRDWHSVSALWNSHAIGTRVFCFSYNPSGHPRPQVTLHSVSVLEFEPPTLLERAAAVVGWHPALTERLLEHLPRHLRDQLADRGLLSVELSDEEWNDSEPENDSEQDEDDCEPEPSRSYETILDAGPAAKRRREE